MDPGDGTLYAAMIGGFAAIAAAAIGRYRRTGRKGREATLSPQHVGAPERDSEPVIRLVNRTYRQLGPDDFEIELDGKHEGIPAERSLKLILCASRGTVSIQTPEISLSSSGRWAVAFRSNVEPSSAWQYRLITESRPL